MKIHTNRRLLIVSFMLGLNACSSSPEKPVDSDPMRDINIPASAPAWVRNPYGAYSPDRYLTAIGSGRDRNAAIEDAKKQMAESFVVKVQSETKSKTQSRLSQDTGGLVAGDTQNETEKNVSLSTETFLRGAEVKEVAEAQSETFALVAVDKLKARSGLLLEAQKIQGRLNPLMDSLEAKFTQEKYKQAKTEQSKLDQLYGEAAALGMSALIDSSAIESRMSRIENALRSKNEKLHFAVKMSNTANFIEHSLESCINDRGGSVYTTERAPENANHVEITLIERPQHQIIEGWTKIRFDLTAAVVQDNGKKYRIQTTQTETGRSRDAVLEAVADKLSDELCEKLFSRMSEASL